MKRLIPAFVLLAGLSGCGTVRETLTPHSQTPPAVPATTDINAQVAAMAAYKGSPVDYLHIGVGLANGWCVAYLNNLTQAANQMEFGSTVATEAGSLGSGIAGALSAGGPVTAIMGLAFPAISQSLIAEGRMATAGVDPGIVYGMVLKQQGAFLAASAPPGSVPEAVMLVSSYASICQPASIRNAVLQAGVNSAASALIPSAGAVRAPPVVTMTAPAPAPVSVPAPNAPAAPIATPAPMSSAAPPAQSSLSPSITAAAKAEQQQMLAQVRSKSQ